MIWPSISGLAKNAALKVIKSDLENKIPNISSLVKKKKKKPDYSTKIGETEKKVADNNHDKYILLQNLIRLKQKIFLQDENKQTW